MKRYLAMACVLLTIGAGPATKPTSRPVDFRSVVTGMPANVQPPKTQSIKTEQEAAANWIMAQIVGHPIEVKASVFEQEGYDPSIAIFSCEPFTAFGIGWAIGGRAKLAPETERQAPHLKNPTLIGVPTKAAFRIARREGHALVAFDVMMENTTATK